MAKRKTLKRNIHQICTDLLAECVAVSLYSTKTDHGNVEALLYSILKTENDFIRRISHTEPGLKPKLYYRDLIDKFNKSISEIVDQINNLS